MKFLNLTLLTPFLLIHGIQSQTTTTGTPANEMPVVHDLSYQVATRTYYKLQKGVSVGDLNPLDYLALQRSTLHEKVVYSVDPMGNLITEIHHISHENAYPEWYKVPSTVRYDHTGTSMQFASDGPDASIVFMPFDSLENPSLIDNEDYTEKGVLSGYVFPSDKQEIQNAFSGLNVDITWSPDKNSVTIQFDTRSQTFDFLNKHIISISPQSEGDGNITVTSYFKPDNITGLDLLAAIVVERDMILDRGYCGSQITIQEFSDYQVGPSQPRGADQRSADPSATADRQESRFTVFPNPVRERSLQLQLDPVFVGVPVVVEIANLSGQRLFAAELVFSSTTETLSLTGSQYNPGLYVLQIANGQSRFAQTIYITQ